MNKFLIFAFQEPGRINSPLKSGKGGFLIPHSRFSFYENLASRSYVIAIPNIVFFPNIPHSCQNFGESRFLGSSQIPYPIIARIPHCILVESRTVFWSNPAESQDPVPDLGPWTTCLCRTQTVFYVLLFEVEFNIMNEESLRWSQRRQSSAGAHHLMGSCLTSRGTQREYSSKPLKHSIVERILVFKR